MRAEDKIPGSPAYNRGKVPYKKKNEKHNNKEPFSIVLATGTQEKAVQWLVSQPMLPATYIENRIAQERASARAKDLGRRKALTKAPLTVLAAASESHA